MVLRGKTVCIMNTLTALVMSFMDAWINYHSSIPTNINSVTKTNLQQRKAINMHYNAYMAAFVVMVITAVYITNVDELQLTEAAESFTYIAIYYYFCVTLPYIKEYFLKLTGLCTLLEVNKLHSSVNSVFETYQMNKWTFITLRYICPIPYVIVYIHETTCDTSSCWLPSPYVMIIKFLRPVIVYTIYSIVKLTMTAITIYRRKNIAVCGVKRNNIKTIIFFTIMATKLTAPIVLHVLWLTNRITINECDSYLGLSLSFLHFIGNFYCLSNKDSSSSTNTGIVRFHCTETSATVTLPVCESVV